VDQQRSERMTQVVRGTSYAPDGRDRWSVGPLPPIAVDRIAPQLAAGVREDQRVPSDRRRAAQAGNRRLGEFCPQRPHPGRAASGCTQVRSEFARASLTHVGDRLRGLSLLAARRNVHGSMVDRYAGRASAFQAAAQPRPAPGFSSPRRSTDLRLRATDQQMLRLRSVPVKARPAAALPRPVCVREPGRSATWGPIESRSAGTPSTPPSTRPAQRAH
jgi:hypothetical protein